jgi:hypothetical protein
LYKDWFRKYATGTEKPFILKSNNLYCASSDLRVNEAAFNLRCFAVSLNLGRGDLRTLDRPIGISGRCTRGCEGWRSVAASRCRCISGPPCACGGDLGGVRI